MSTFIRLNDSLHIFYLCFSLHQVQRKRGFFEDTLPSAWIWKCSFYVVVWTMNRRVLENNDAHCTHTHCAWLYMHVVPAIHFIHVTKDMFMSLYIRFILHFCKDIYSQLLFYGKRWWQLCFRPYMEWQFCVWSGNCSLYLAHYIRKQMTNAIVLIVLITFWLFRFFAKTCADLLSIAGLSCQRCGTEVGKYFIVLF